MPIALSNWKIINTTFTATSVDNFVSQMNDLLVSVHWVSTVVTGGFKLLATSPQGLRIYLYIRNLGHISGVFGTLQATFNFQSLDGTITGMDQEIAVSGIPAEIYTIIAGKCQFALARFGIDSGIVGTSLVGGIPFIPDEQLCSGAVPSIITDQCFVAMGDHNAAGSPRKYLILGSGIFSPEIQESSEALWGTDLCLGGNAIGSVRMPVLTTAPYIFQGFNFPSPDIWATQDFWRMEPFLVWGVNNSSQPILRAQWWDSMVFAKPFIMDYTVQMDGLDWIVYTNNYFYGCLAFIITPTGDNGTKLPGNDGNLAAFLYD